MPMSYPIFRTIRRTLWVVAGGVMFAAFAVSPGFAPAQPSPASLALSVNDSNGVQNEERRSSEGGDLPRTRPARRPQGDDIIITPDEWAQLEGFMQVHSPSKWQMYLSLPDKPLKQGLRKQIAQRYRTLQRVEKSDPVRWKLEIEAIAIEDRIYATLQELKLGIEDGGNERQLRADVDLLVGNRDNWRKERLIRVKAELESLKLPASIRPVEEEIERLNKMTPDDRRGRVDKRIEEFKKHMDRPPRALLGGRGQAPGAGG